MLKLLEENTGINLCDIGLGNDFSDKPPKVQAIDKQDFIKNKNMHVSQDAIKKVRRQPTNLEEKYANRMSGKDLYSEDIKSLLQLNEITNNPTKKWAKNLNILQRYMNA